MEPTVRGKTADLTLANIFAVAKVDSEDSRDRKKNAPKVGSLTIVAWTAKIRFDGLIRHLAIVENSFRTSGSPMWQLRTRLTSLRVVSLDWRDSHRANLMTAKQK